MCHIQRKKKKKMANYLCLFRLSQKGQILAIPPSLLVRKNQKFVSPPPPLVRKNLKLVMFFL